MATGAQLEKGLWPAAFSTRRNLYPDENTPYIQSLNFDNDSIIRRFMRDPDESLNCTPRADFVERFCGDASPEGLLDEVWSDRNVVLLDDRAFSGEAARSRSSAVPLTALQLYEKLRKPRFGQTSQSNGRDLGPNSTQMTPEEANDKQESQAPGSPLPSTPFRSTSPSAQQDKRAGPQHLQEEAIEPEPFGPFPADRRLIFVTNIDKWTISALVATATYHQADALRNALYMHLSSHCFIGVTFSLRSLPTFNIAVHLPYFALRTSLDPALDSRIDLQGRPVRKVRDVTFLNWESDYSSFLYEAKYSCVVTGSDEWRWKGYCFVDTWFDDVDEFSLDDDRKPLAYIPEVDTAHSIERPFCDPRTYFLRVLRVRLGLVVQEWWKIVDKMAVVCKHEDVSHRFFTRTSADCSYYEYRT